MITQSDEGKGITTDFLSSLDPNSLVIRYSGGQQAGHTVVFNGVRHVFSNFGSGTLRDIPTYWSKFCTMDPIGIINELEILKSKGINPLLFIDGKCPVTTPYDLYYNRKTEAINQHGSCGLGVGATIEREENHYSLLFEDLFNPTILTIKLSLIMQYYADYDIKLLVDTSQFLKSVIRLTESPNIHIIKDNLSRQSLLLRSNLIFESSQGLLLDQNIGFFPHVTRSNTGTKNIVKELSGISTDSSFEYYLVTRAYQTRHGNGPMTNDLPNNILINPIETNVTNEYQGIFKRSILDLNLLEYAINKDEILKYTSCKNLVITCLDHVVDAYVFVYKNEIIHSTDENSFIEKIGKILNIHSIYISRTDESKNIIKFK